MLAIEEPQELDFLPVFRSNPQRGDRRSLAYCAINGQIPHWVPHWPVTPSPALVDGDFEQWTDDVTVGWQRVTGWQGRDYVGRSYRDDTVKAQGAASMRLENTLETDIVQVSQNVAVRIDDLALDERGGGEWRPLMQPGLPPEHDFVKQWVELFHGEGRPYLMLGEMIRPPKLWDIRLRDPDLPQTLIDLSLCARGCCCCRCVNERGRLY